MERSKRRRSQQSHQHHARSRRSSGWSLNRPIDHAVDLARHDKIVLVQSLDLLGAQRDGRVTPAEADIGVMAFGLGKLSPTRCTKASASRKLRNRNVRSMRWASSRNSQSGACFWKCSASSRASGGTPPRQGVQIFSARVSVMRLSAASLSKAMAVSQRSISPNTMSSEPMIAETSASICPRLKKPIACRWANDGARILHL